MHLFICEAFRGQQPCISGMLCQMTCLLQYCRLDWLQVATVWMVASACSEWHACLYALLKAVMLQLQGLLLSRPLSTPALLLPQCSLHVGSHSLLLLLQRHELAVPGGSCLISCSLSFLASLHTTGAGQGTGLPLSKQAAVGFETQHADISVVQLQASSTPHGPKHERLSPSGADNEDDATQHQCTELQPDLSLKASSAQVCHAAMHHNK